MAKFSVCKYQSYQRNVNDDCDMPPVFCKKIKDFCVSQKPCSELKKWVVNEKEKMYCTQFEDAFNK